MRQLADYPLCLQEAWAGYNVLRNLGFSAPQIDFSISRAGEVLVTLRAQDKKFTLCVAMVSDSVATAARMERQWNELLDDIDEYDDDDIRGATEVWLKSGPLEVIDQICDRMRRQGFVFPAELN